MKKQTQAIHLEYERRDAYDSLSVPVYNTLAYEFDNAAVMAVSIKPGAMALARIPLAPIS